MANQYEMDGSVKLIYDTQSFPSGFQKREFVITTEDKYPQDVKFEVMKDKCTMLDAFKPGARVKVNFDIRGNEYKDRYYVNLNAWKIQESSGSSAPSSDDRPAHLEDATAAAFVEPDEEPF